MSPRGAKRDNTETMARNFDDPDSFVSLDGREFLAGQDWKKRKKAVFFRTTFHRCEWKGCTRLSEHIHHIKPKGKGGSDDWNNLMAICRVHHVAVHPEKQLRFTRRSK